MEKINWTDRVQNIAIVTQGRKENPVHKSAYIMDRQTQHFIVKGV